MTSVATLFEYQGAFRPSVKPVIFLQDQIIAFFDTDKLRWRGSTDVGPGQIVLVLYGVGDVGGGYVGAYRLHAFELVLQEALTLADPQPPCNTNQIADPLLAMARGQIALSQGQRSALIDHIRQQDRYWWDNAAKDVQEVLAGGEGPRDRARRCLREATEAWDGSEKQEPTLRLVKEALALYPALANARYLQRWPSPEETSRKQSGSAKQNSLKPKSPTCLTVIRIFP